ncbi:MAG TPA: ATP-grasp domain-containing protein [Stellaceae bacterium]|nr:ATP-grasp domain-containing protein [Stellaceae bacterium]
MNALMVAFAFTLPYHVMRTAAAAGLRVRVLGDAASAGLRRSRVCRGFDETHSAGDPELLLAEIAELARRHAIDIVFPADDVSTRLLALLGDRLPVRCVPLPDLATFDLLNDKGNFTRFCRDNGVRAPRFWLFDDAAGLRAALRGGEVDLPVTVKPTNRSGGIGVVHIREPAELDRLDAIDYRAIDYRPVLVQRHVSGEPVSITALCDDGRVVAHVAHQRDARRFRVFADADLLANIASLAALTRYRGIINCDAVLRDDGRAFLVECNPRFWYSIYLVMLAGLNFVELALAPGAPALPATLECRRFRLSLRAILARPWRASRLDWAFLRYNFGDPFAFALQRAKPYDDSEVAVPVDMMTGRAMTGGGIARPAAPRLAVS